MIRLATKADIDIIANIFEIARNYMKSNNNPTQWGDNHPATELLLEDIEKKQLYLLVEGDKIYAAFVLLEGGDPLYTYIEDGAWHHDTPYIAIHRIASNGEKRGIFTTCVEYALSKCNHIRIDTHAANTTMQHAILANGFKKCGTVYMEDGTARIAYDKLVE